MSIYNNLSHETIKPICEYFNGNPDPCIFMYRSAGQICSNFNKKFNLGIYTDKRSRWEYVEMVFKYFDEQNRLDYFFNTMFSIRNIRKDNPNLTEDQCAELRVGAIKYFNTLLNRDDYELVDRRGSLSIREIDSTLENIGVGGFAEVYKDIEKNIVVKKLKDEYKSDRTIVSRFKREYDIQKNSLSDIPGIIKVYDFNEAELSYTMEYCEMDLEKYIKNNNVSQQDYRRLIFYILSIMRSVHDRDVIHRDISPKNIFIKDTYPVIADFGLGKDLNKYRSHQTFDSAYQGTLDYCDPRQIRELAEGDKYSDIYSLGKIINFIINKDPNNYDHEFGLQAVKATSENAVDRFQSIDEFIESLKKVIQDQKNEEYTTLCKQFILTRKYNKLLNNYLFSFMGIDLVYEMNEDNFRYVYKQLFLEKENYPVLEKILSSTVDALRSERLAFKYLDGFGEFAVDLLATKDISIGITMKAIQIVNIIGYGVNRYFVINYYENKLKSGQIDKKYDSFIEK